MSSTAASSKASVTTSGKGRQKFLRSEQINILKYVAEHSDPTRPVGGNKIWKEMALYKITKHSWHAMRDHYLKHLKGKEHLYQLSDRLKYSRIQFRKDASPTTDDDGADKDAPRDAEEHRSEHSNKDDSINIDMFNSSDEEEKESGDPTEPTEESSAQATSAQGSPTKTTTAQATFAQGSSAQACSAQESSAQETSAQATSAQATSAQRSSAKANPAQATSAQVDSTLASTTLRRSPLKRRGKVTPEEEETQGARSDNGAGVLKSSPGVRTVPAGSDDMDDHLSVLAFDVKKKQVKEEAILPEKRARLKPNDGKNGDIQDVQQDKHQQVGSDAVQEPASAAEAQEEHEELREEDGMLEDEPRGDEEDEDHLLTVLEGCVKIKELMTEFSLSLLMVTRALYYHRGDVGATRTFLRTGKKTHVTPRPGWSSDIDEEK
ncbi:uncharacterized protein LOC144876575 isoform X2 [Branchiostoma floridae x Branchiostoma japonicum]